MSQEYLKKAEEILNAAIVIDKKGLVADAIKGYMKGLDWLEMAAKYEPRQIERIRLKERMNIYANRIETLKAAQLTTLSKIYVPEYLKRKNPTTLPCKVCTSDTLLNDLVICNVCDLAICPKCIYVCLICGLPVCTNDLDQKVIGKVCYIHTSPKETVSLIVSAPPAPKILKQAEEQSKEVKEEQPNIKECVICIDNLTNPSAVVPCGHTGFCFKCVSDPAIKACPTCRGPIERILKLFG